MKYNGNGIDFVLMYNEELDAVISLEFISENINRVLQSDYYWKWNIIAFHSALQGFMVLALQDGSKLSVLDKKSRKHWYSVYKGKIKPTKRQKLDYFLNFYSDIKSDKMKKYSGSVKFEPNDKQDEYINLLHIYRNEFIHLIPAEYALDKRKFCEIIINVVPIIEFLVFKSNNIFLRETISKDHISSLCNLLKSQAQIILERYQNSLNLVKNNSTSKRV